MPIEIKSESYLDRGVMGPMVRGIRQLLLETNGEQLIFGIDGDGTLNVRVNTGIHKTAGAISEDAEYFFERFVDHHLDHVKKRGG